MIIGPSITRRMMVTWMNSPSPAVSKGTSTTATT